MKNKILHICIIIKTYNTYIMDITTYARADFKSIWNSTNKFDLCEIMDKK